jgi:D-tagatose-1,6-bisphosphate aldolase subunit GatZ/KbaZ
MAKRAKTQAGLMNNEHLLEIVRLNLSGTAVGICSVCSAHPLVLRAAMSQALKDESPVLIESTSNQVNQFGGYTGMTPEAFVEFVKGIAGQVGFPLDRVILGGDHLGPLVWRSEPAGTAMAKARDLIGRYVRAGFRKIHLDTSMSCADDAEKQGLALSEETKARRAAELCSVAEQTWQGLPRNFAPPLYVLGTEVPVPGGERAGSAPPVVTSVEDADRTLTTLQAAFEGHGLGGAWERVVGLVVQPGVEFGDAVTFPYRRDEARRLSKFIEERGTCVFEAHSTDYQTGEALRQLVEDHYAILKVGPWLTFTLREGVFSLCEIEQEWLSGRAGVCLSRVGAALEQAMLDQPADWRGYYQGDDWYLAYARKYSYSDRSRYYWPKPAVEQAFSRLIHNLSAEPIPLPLLSQFLPLQYEAVRNGEITSRPLDLIEHKIRSVLRTYSSACGL